MRPHVSLLFTVALGALLAAAPALAAPAAKPGVVKIVFVGKQYPCECTAKTIAASRAALERALGEPASVPVEEVKLDVDPARIAPLRQQRPLRALPGLYFVDARGVVLELLEGSVTEAQITTALRR